MPELASVAPVGVRRAHSTNKATVLIIFSQGWHRQHENPRRVFSHLLLFVKNVRYYFVCVVEAMFVETLLKPIFVQKQKIRFNNISTL